MMLSSPFSTSPVSRFYEANPLDTIVAAAAAVVTSTATTAASTSSKGPDEEEGGNNNNNNNNHRAQLWRQSLVDQCTCLAPPPIWTQEQQQQPQQPRGRRRHRRRPQQQQQTQPRQRATQEIPVQSYTYYSCQAVQDEVEVGIEIDIDNHYQDDYDGGSDEERSAIVVNSSSDTNDIHRYQSFDTENHETDKIVAHSVSLDNTTSRTTSTCDDDDDIRFEHSEDSHNHPFLGHRRSTRNTTAMAFFHSQPHAPQQQQEQPQQSNRYPTSDGASSSCPPCILPQQQQQEGFPSRLNSMPNCPTAFLSLRRDETSPPNYSATQTATTTIDTATTAIPPTQVQNCCCAQHHHHKQQQQDFVDPYQVLQIRRDATLSEIRHAYRRLALWHHPARSVHVTEAERTRRTYIFDMLAACYETLTDLDTRQRCDLFLREWDMMQACQHQPTHHTHESFLMVGDIYIGGRKLVGTHTATATNSATARSNNPQPGDLPQHGAASAAAAAAALPKARGLEAAVAAARRLVTRMAGPSQEEVPEHLQLQQHEQMHQMQQRGAPAAELYDVPSLSPASTTDDDDEDDDNDDGREEGSTSSNNNINSTSSSSSADSFSTAELVNDNEQEQLGQEMQNDGNDENHLGNRQPMNDASDDNTNTAQDQPRQETELDREVKALHQSLNNNPRADSHLGNREPMNGATGGNTNTPQDQPRKYQEDASEVDKEVTASPQDLNNDTSSGSGSSPTTSQEFTAEYDDGLQQLTTIEEGTDEDATLISSYQKKTTTKNRLGTLSQQQQQQSGTSLLSIRTSVPAILVPSSPSHNSAYLSPSAMTTPKVCGSSLRASIMPSAPQERLPCPTTKDKQQQQQQPVNNLASLMAGCGADLVGALKDDHDDNNNNINGILLHRVGSELNGTAGELPPVNTSSTSTTLDPSVLQASSSFHSSFGGGSGDMVLRITQPSNGNGKKRSHNKSKKSNRGKNHSSTTSFLSMQNHRQHKADIQYTEMEVDRLFGGPLKLLYRARRWRPFTPAATIFDKVFESNALPVPNKNVPERKPSSLSTTSTTATTSKPSSVLQSGMALAQMTKKQHAATLIRPRSPVSVLPSSRQRSKSPPPPAVPCFSMFGATGSTTASASAAAGLSTSSLATTTTTTTSGASGQAAPPILQPQQQSCVSETLPNGTVRIITSRVLHRRKLIRTETVDKNHRHSIVTVTSEPLDDENDDDENDDDENDEHDGGNDKNPAAAKLKWDCKCAQSCTTDGCGILEDHYDDGDDRRRGTTATSTKSAWCYSYHNSPVDLLHTTEPSTRTMATGHSSDKENHRQHCLDFCGFGSTGSGNSLYRLGGLHPRPSSSTVTASKEHDVANLHNNNNNKRNNAWSSSWQSTLFCGSCMWLD